MERPCWYRWNQRARQHRLIAGDDVLANIQFESLCALEGNVIAACDDSLHRGFAHLLVNVRDGRQGTAVDQNIVCFRRSVGQEIENAAICRMGEPTVIFDHDRGSRRNCLYEVDGGCRSWIGNVGVADMCRKLVKSNL